MICEKDAVAKREKRNKVEKNFYAISMNRITNLKTSGVMKIHIRYFHYHAKVFKREVPHFNFLPISPSIISPICSLRTDDLGARTIYYFLGLWFELLTFLILISFDLGIGGFYLEVGLFLVNGFLALDWNWMVGLCSICSFEVALSSRFSRMMLLENLCPTL